MAPALDGYLAACQEACNGEIRRLCSGNGQPPSRLFEMVLDYPMRGGKALRPALSIAVCLGLGGRLEAILPTAATLELYHNAFLIHDDIEDESLLRRGRSTMHVDHGIPIAVNVGDAMLSMSLQPLLDNVEMVGLGPALRILRAIARMTRQTVEGQAVELEWVRSNVWRLVDADYLAMVELKTSWYSFITPLQAGAIAAGARAEQLAPLERLGRHLGAAFQITDDLLNLRGDPQDYGKEIGGDLWEGKRTLMLLHALRGAGPDEQADAVRILARRRPGADRHRPPPELLDSLVSAGDLSAAGHRKLLEWLGGDPDADRPKTLEDIRWLYRLMHRLGSLDYARAVAAAQADEAASVLATLDWFPASHHRDVLTDLVGYVHERTR